MTSEKLDSRLAQMEANYERKNDELSEMIRQLTATVAKIELEKNSKNEGSDRPVNPPAQANFIPPYPFGYAQPPQSNPFCRNCNQWGHVKTRCPRIKCYECQGLDHIGIYCPKRREGAANDQQKN